MGDADGIVEPTWSVLADGLSRTELPSTATATDNDKTAAKAPKSDCARIRVRTNCIARGKSRARSLYTHVLYVCTSVAEVCVISEASVRSYDGRSLSTLLLLDGELFFLCLLLLAIKRFGAGYEGSELNWSNVYIIHTLRLD